MIEGGRIPSISRLQSEAILQVTRRCRSEQFSSSSLMGQGKVADPRHAAAGGRGGRRIPGIVTSRGERAGDQAAEVNPTIQRRMKARRQAKRLPVRGRHREARVRSLEGRVPRLLRGLLAHGEGPKQHNRAREISRGARDVYVCADLTHWLISTQVRAGAGGRPRHVAAVLPRNENSTRPTEACTDPRLEVNKTMIRTKGWCPTPEELKDMMLTGLPAAAGCEGYPADCYTSCYDKCLAVGYTDAFCQCKRRLRPDEGQLFRPRARRRRPRAAVPRRDRRSQRPKGAVQLLGARARARNKLRGASSPLPLVHSD